VETAAGFAGNRAGLYPAEDNVSCTLKFTNGIIGSGQWDFCSDTEKDEVEVWGAKGRIRFATFADRPVELESDGTQEKWDIPHPPHIQQPHIQSIVDELNGRGKCPSDGRSGARTSFVTDLILQPWREKNNIIFKPYQ
jgi:hypothetical protein